MKQSLISKILFSILILGTATTTPAGFDVQKVKTFFVTQGSNIYAKAPTKEAMLAFGKTSVNFLNDHRYAAASILAGSYLLRVNADDTFKNQFTTFTYVAKDAKNAPVFSYKFWNYNYSSLNPLQYGITKNALLALKSSFINFYAVLVGKNVLLEATVIETLKSNVNDLITKKNDLVSEYENNLNTKILESTTNNNKLMESLKQEHAKAINKEKTNFENYQKSIITQLSLYNNIADDLLIKYAKNLLAQNGINNKNSLSEQLNLFSDSLDNAKDENTKKLFASLISERKNILLQTVKDVILNNPAYLTIINQPLV